MRPLAGAFVILAAACASAEPRLPASIPPAEGEWLMSEGVRYMDISTGSGAPVQARRCAYVHYTGWLMDGTSFDTSRDSLPNGIPQPPIGFQADTRQVIHGWDIGMRGMRVGGQRRLVIPPRAAYGEQGAPPAIPPRATLVFDIEVVGVGDPFPGFPGSPGGCPPWPPGSR